MHVNRNLLPIDLTIKVDNRNQHGKDELKSIIGHLITAQKTLLIAGFCALGTSPLYLLSLSKLDSPNLQYTAVWFLCVISLYLIYVSLEYKRVLQKTRQLRLEKNFLRYHTTQEPFMKTVQYEDTIWTNSYLFKLCRQIAFPNQDYEFVFEKQPESNKIKHVTSSKQFYRTFANPDLENSFETTFGRLCPRWLNYSFGFLLGFVWLLLKFNERVPSELFQELSGWYYLAWVSLAGCFICELMGVYFRYQCYLEFPDLKTELLYFIASIIAKPTQEEVVVVPAPKVVKQIPNRQLKPEKVPRTPRWEDMIGQAQDVVKKMSPDIGKHLPEFHPKTWVPQGMLIPTSAPLTQTDLHVKPHLNTIKEPDTLTDYRAYQQMVEAEPTTEELVWTGLDTYVVLSKEHPTLMDAAEPMTVLGDENMLPTFSNLHQLVK